MQTIAQTTIQLGSLNATRVIYPPVRAAFSNYCLDKNFNAMPF